MSPDSVIYSDEDHTNWGKNRDLRPVYGVGIDDCWTVEGKTTESVYTHKIFSRPMDWLSGILKRDAKFLGSGLRKKGYSTFWG